MGIKKQLQGHGDPLLLEVVTRQEKTLASKHEHELYRDEAPELDVKDEVGVRGVGERNFCTGDPLLKESQRYHEAEHDHVAEGAHKLAINESLLKRHKRDSLTDAYSGALFDPILQEYVIPYATLSQLKAFEEDMEKKRLIFREMSLSKRHISSSLFSSHTGVLFDPVLQEYVLLKASLSEMKALEEDIKKKRMLFHEMSMRKRKNLSSLELFCDPLVHSYRMKELLFKRTTKTNSSRRHVKMDETKDELHSKHCNLNAGGPRLTESDDDPRKKMVPVPATLSEYRKLNAGDDLFTATMGYADATKLKTGTPKAALPCKYRKMNAGDPIQMAMME